MAKLDKVRLKHKQGIEIDGISFKCHFIKVSFHQNIISPKQHFSEAALHQMLITGSEIFGEMCTYMSGWGSAAYMSIQRNAAFMKCCFNEMLL
jgi:hypothetical protein